MPKKWNRQTPYRSNLQAVVTELQKLELREEHLEVLQRTPFWLLVNSIHTNTVVLEHCKKRDTTIKEIIQCFNKDSRDFTFGRYTMKISVSDVRIIFGVRDGRLSINMQLQDYTRTTFLHRCFPEKEKEKDLRMSKSSLYRKLTTKSSSNDVTDVIDVARLVTLYLLASFFISTKSSNLPWAYTSLVEDLDMICNYNWSEHILNTLLNSLVQSNSENHSGCVLILPYCLCERTKLINPIQGNLIPKFLKWNLESLHKKVQSIDIKELDREYIIKRSLTLSIEENELLHKINAFQPESPINHSTDEPEHLHAQKILLIEATPTEEPPLEAPGQYESLIPDSTIAGVLIELKERSTNDNVLDDDDIPISQLEETKTMLMLKDLELKELQLKFEEMKRQKHELENVNAQLHAEMERLKREKDSINTELSNIKEASLILNDEKEQLLKENQKQSSVVKQINERMGRQLKREKDHTYTDQRKTKRPKNEPEKEAETEEGKDAGKEIIVLDDFVEEEGTKKRDDYNAPFKFKSSMHVMKKLTEKERAHIMTINDKDGRWGIIWKDRHGKKTLLVKDIGVIINNLPLYNNIIDCWAIILNNHLEKKGMKKLSYVFDSLAWQYVAKISLGLYYRDAADRFVNKKLPEAMLYRFLIFPINTCAREDPLTSQGYHWTLLVFDIQECKWTHYNSILPRNEETDYYFERAKIMKDYVEEKMKEHIEESPISAGVQSSPSEQTYEIESYKEAAQQKPGSMDCAVFVCMNMDKIMRGEPVPINAKMDINTGYRLKMAKVILQDEAYNN